MIYHLSYNKATKLFETYKDTGEIVQMTTYNPKLYRLCGQHINASDDKCTDLKRHPYLEWDMLVIEQKIIRSMKERGIVMKTKNKRWNTSQLIIDRIIELMKHDGFHKDAREAVNDILTLQQNKDCKTVNRDTYDD